MSLLARVCWHGGFGCTIGQSWRQIGQAFSQRGSWRESRTQTMTLMERPASGATYGPAYTRPSAATAIRWMKSVRARDAKPSASRRLDRRSNQWNDREPGVKTWGQGAPGCWSKRRGWMRLGVSSIGRGGGRRRGVRAATGDARDPDRLGVREGDHHLSSSSAGSCGTVSVLPGPSRNSQGFAS